MQLRDYFAGQALVFLDWKCFCQIFPQPNELRQAIAECAYEIADAMLVARDKSPSKFPS